LAWERLSEKYQPRTNQSLVEVENKSNKNVLTEIKNDPNKLNVEIERS